MKISKKHTLGIIPFGLALAVIVFILSVCSSLFWYNLYEKYQREQTRVTLELTHRTIEEAFFEYQNIVEILAYSMEADFNVASFEQSANKALKKNNCKYIYLVKGSTVVSAIPQDLLHDQKGKSLKDYPYIFSMSQVLQKPVVDGPITVNDQQRCLLFAKPIFKNSVCIGQVIVVVDADQVLGKINLDYLYNNGYDYEFWRIDIQDGHKNVIQTSDTQKDLSDAERVTFFLPTEWILLMRPVGGWVTVQMTMFIFFINATFWLLLLICVLCILRLRQYRKEKEDLTFIDTDTGLLNSRGFLRELNQLTTAEQREYTLFFFAMDEYIALSRKLDTETGRSYIDHIINKLQNYIYNEHIIGRVGESSFVIAVFDKLSPKKAADLARGISLDLLWKIELNGERAYIHANWHFVRYPQDGTDPEILLNNVVRDYEYRDLTR